MSFVALALAATAVIGLAIPSTRLIGLLAAVVFAVLCPATPAALAALVPLVVFCFKKRNHLHELSRLRHFRH
jgi:hypothetical protein